MLVNHTLNSNNHYYDFAIDKLNFFSLGEKLKLTNVFKTSYNIFNQPQNTLKTYISDEKIKKLLEAKGKLEKYFNEWKIYESKNISLINISENSYPKKLKNIPSPPFNLYFKGSLPDFSKPSISIIGARMCSPYGKKIAEILGYELGKRNIPIISGMAKGIDGISQSSCIEAGGYSIGVLGCGVDICYPKTNLDLYKNLENKGCILSEYMPGTKPLSCFFPARNRIISGLSDILIVIEAKMKSGTLITTDFALDQGKTVFAVPGRITDEISKGCNYLISQGASILYSVDEFLDEFMESYELYKKIEFNAAKNSSLNSNLYEKLNKTENKVYKALDFSPKTLEELVSLTHLELNQIKTSLMSLEINGYATELSKGFYIKS